jgi:hypothetical protein
LLGSFLTVPSYQHPIADPIGFGTKLSLEPGGMLCGIDVLCKEYLKPALDPDTSVSKRKPLKTKWRGSCPVLDRIAVVEK